LCAISVTFKCTYQLMESPAYLFASCNSLTKCKHTLIYSCLFFMGITQHGEGEEDPHLVLDRSKLRDMIDLDNAKEKVLDKPEIKKVTDDIAIPAEWSQDKYQPEFVKATVLAKCNQTKNQHNLSLN
jgi:hypothetical protein